MLLKVLNQSWNHNGFQYQLGLNIDTEKFNPSGMCETGGLYFTDNENVHKYLGYGCYIAEVEVPPDAQVYADPEGDKWKADRLIIKAVYKFTEYPLTKDEAWRLKVADYNQYPPYVMDAKTPLECLNVVQRHGDAFKFMPVQTKEICLAAVRKYASNLQYVEDQTEELCNFAVHREPFALRYIINQTEEMCIEAVAKAGIALKYVKEQTEKICLAAVKNCGNSLVYVHDKTEEICRIAVKQNPYAVLHITDPSEELCILAVSIDGGVFKSLKRKTRDICDAAIENYPKAAAYYNSLLD